MDPSTPLRADALTAIVLATVAGCVDAVGYLVLGGVLVAHMSGNTAVGALRLEGAVWAEALARLSPLPGFLVGTALGNLAARALSGHGRFALPGALLAELVLLGAALALAWNGIQSRFGSVTLLALAMGVQGASLRRLAGHTVHTTFVTGMLIKLVDELGDRWYGGREPVRPGLHGGVWCGFFIGALAGAASVQRLGARALLVPMALLTVAALLGYFRPPAAGLPR